MSTTVLVHKRRKVIDMPEEELYKHLVETDPEGREYLNNAEKKDFEDWLGV